QWPIGWISDRMDRRLLIVIVTATAAAACVVAIATEASTIALYGAMFLIGGTVNPLYALIIAHTNDFLDHEDMASASSGLVFVTGVGAIGGPLIVGQMMEFAGPWAFFLYIMICMGAISAYGLYRMTQRAATPVDETSSYALVTPTGSPVAVDIAQEVAIEQAIAEEEAAEREDAPV
ncbi:MAG: MFS transporter, partial [Pseudomonadota bacterium]